MPERRLSPTTLMLTSTVSCAVGMVMALMLWSLYSVDQSARSLNRLGERLAQDLAFLSLEAMIQSDRARLGLLAKRMAGRAEVRAIEMYDPNGVALVVEGNPGIDHLRQAPSPGATALPSVYVSEVAVQDTVAGEVRVTLHEATYAFPTRRFLGQYWPALAAILVIIAIVTYLGARLAQPRATTARRDRSSREANAAEPWTGNPSTTDESTGVAPTVWPLGDSRHGSSTGEATEPAAGSGSDPSPPAEGSPRAGRAAAGVDDRGNANAMAASSPGTGNAWTATVNDTETTRPVDDPETLESVTREAADPRPMSHVPLDSTLVLVATLSHHKDMPDRDAHLIRASALAQHVAVSFGGRVSVANGDTVALTFQPNRSVDRAFDVVCAGSVMQQLLATVSLSGNTVPTEEPGQSGPASDDAQPASSPFRIGLDLIDSADNGVPSQAAVDTAVQAIVTTASFVPDGNVAVGQAAFASIRHRERLTLRALENPALRTLAGSLLPEGVLVSLEQHHAERVAQVARRVQTLAEG